MAVAGSIVNKISADTTEYTKGLDEAKKKTGSFFKDLQSQFGKSSTLGKSLKLIAGTGAIAGIGLAAKEFEHFSEKIKELSESNISSTSEFAEKLAESLPIIGRIYDGFKNIGLAITDINDIQRSAARQDLVTDIIKTTIAEQKKAAKEIEELWRKTNQHIALLGKNDAGKSLLGAGFDLTNALTDAKNAPANPKIVEQKQKMKSLFDQERDAETPSFWQSLKSNFYSGKSQQTSRELLEIKKQIATASGAIKEAQTTDQNKNLETRRAAYHKFWADFRQSASTAWGDLENGFTEAWGEVNKVADQDAEEIFKKKIQEQTQLWDEVKNKLKEIETPLDKYRNKVTELQALFGKGVLSQSDFDKLKTAADKQLSKDQQGGAIPGLNVGEVRSSFTIGATGSDVLKQQLETQKQNLVANLKTAAGMEKLARGASDGFLSVVGNLF